MLDVTPTDSSSESFEIGISDFQTAFGEKLSPYVQNKISEYGFRYQKLTLEERDAVIARIVGVLLGGKLIQAGQLRHSHWETGWGENFEALKSTGNLDAIIPRYFEKFNIVRWKQEWIKPASKDFEYRMLAIIQDWLFDHYLRSMSSVYEFGCGTGHNLFRVRHLNRDAELHGLDWAASSQSILENIRASGADPKVFGRHFDYFNPDYSFDLKRNSAVYTVASLEQIGDKWGPFLDYLLEKSPSIVIHIEPIAELLDRNSLLDLLSIEYFEKRNYLKGFLTGLRKSADAGRIKIERAQRTFIGSFFIEGYSVIVWRPITSH